MRRHRLALTFALAAAVIAFAAGGFGLGRATRPGPLQPLRPLHLSTMPVHVSAIEDTGSVPGFCGPRTACPAGR